MTFQVIVSAVLATINVPVVAPAADVYECKIIGKDGVEFATQKNTAANFTFNGVPEGDYTAQMARLDTTGASIGTVVTAEFSAHTIPPVMVPVDIPSSLTITVTVE